MRAPALVSSAVVGFVVLTAACGGDSGTPPTSPTPPPSVAPPSTTIEIVGELGSQSFAPNPASLGPERTVAWRNTHGVVHRVVANDGSFDTGNLAVGATSGVLTIPAGGINYHCPLHPGMIGAISGTSGIAPPCTGQYCDDD